MDGLDKLMSGKLRPPGRPKGSRTRRRRSRSRKGRVSRRRSRRRRSRSRRRRSRSRRRRSRSVSKGRKRSKKSRSRRRSGRRGNPQAAQAMRIMRSEGISLKAAWAKVKGGKGGKKHHYRVTQKSINKHFNKKT